MGSGLQTTHESVPNVESLVYSIFSAAFSSMPLPVSSIRCLKDIAQRAPESFDSIPARPFALKACRLQVAFKLLEIVVEVIQL